MPNPNGRSASGKRTSSKRHVGTQAPLAALIRSSADAIVGETLEGIVTDWNPAAERLYGYRADEVVGRHLSMVVPPERMAEAVAILARARRGEHVADVETERWTKDGRRVDVSLSVSPVWNDAGEVVATSAIVRDITERKDADAALAAAHQQTRQVLERITDGFVAVDRDWRFTYINDAAERMLERTREELLGSVGWELFAPAVETPVYVAAQQAMRAGVTTSVEFHYPPLGAWFDVRFYPSEDGLSVFFRDVTERRRLTEELRASETRYRTLVEQVPVVIYVQANDERQTATYFSPQFEELTGFTMAEVMDQPAGEHWLDFVHPEDRDRVAAGEASSLETGDPFRCEYRLRRSDGGYVWVRDECVAVRDEAEEIVAWQGVLLDISDRIEAEEAQARLAAIVESADDAVFSSTLDGTITTWNAGAERLYGYRAVEIIGQSYAVLLPEFLDDPFLQERILAVCAGDMIEPFESVRRRRDGSPVNVAISLSPIRGHDGAVIGVSSITRDVTERKRAEVALAAALADAEAASRAKSHFLAMMSHELRTPLQAVLGYTEFLLTSSPASLTTEQREDVVCIQRGGRRMLTLVNQLLDLSRIEAGRLDVDHEPVDLAAILEQVRQDVVPQAIQKGVVLTIRLPESVPPALGDEERVRQIVLNLVGNAVKFTEMGSVTVTVQATDAEMAVVVRDTGCGIAPEALPHIFDQFHQADNRLALRHGGAGLGLAISQKLSELMGGRITVESALGRGSTFTLFMPAADGSAADD